MFISSAHASAPAPTAATTATTGTPADGAPAAAPSIMDSPAVPLLAMFVIFYFILIRPQQRKIKEHEALVTGIKRGDKVVTGGGIYGQVTKVEADSQYIMVEIAQGVNVRVLRQTVMTVVDKLPSDEPAKDKKDKKADKGDLKPTANDNAEAK